MANNGIEFSSSSHGIEEFVGVRKILKLVLIDSLENFRIDGRQYWFFLEKIYVEVANITCVFLPFCCNIIDWNGFERLIYVSDIAMSRPAL